MNIWKRNAVAAAVVLFVCAAVYLNWQGAEPTLGESSLNAGKTLGEAELVNSEARLELEETDPADVSADGSFAQDALAPEELRQREEALTGNEDSYFDTARLNREEARDSALTILRQTVQDPEANEKAVSAATDSIAAMASATLQESEIENLITAKGYTDCVAFIGDDSVSVVVSSPRGDLTPEDVARVTDIVCTQTQFSPANVKVVQAQA
jgi:stage III sporulation protein AH